MYESALALRLALYVGDGGLQKFFCFVDVRFFFYLQQYLFLVQVLNSAHRRRNDVRTAFTEYMSQAVLKQACRCIET